jgi:TRAP-type C4-dicarboxylate transport system permease small subunit
MPLQWRRIAVIVAEILVIGFFAMLAWAGLRVLEVLEGMSLVSLNWVPIQLTQSVIPIGAILFIIAELLSLPDYWRDIMAGRSSEHPPLAHGATPDDRAGR